MIRISFLGMIRLYRCSGLENVICKSGHAMRWRSWLKCESFGLVGCKIGDVRVRALVHLM